MSMDGAVWEEIGLIKARLKDVEIKVGIRRSDGTLVSALVGQAPSAAAFPLRHNEQGTVKAGDYFIINTGAWRGSPTYGENETD